MELLAGDINARLSVADRDNATRANLGRVQDLIDDKAAEIVKTVGVSKTAEIAKAEEADMAMAKADVEHQAGLRKNVRRLVALSSALEQATSDCIFDWIIQLSRKREGILPVVEYYEAKIRTIIGQMMSCTDDDGNLQWRVAERCFRESCQVTIGELHSAWHYEDKEQAEMSDLESPDPIPDLEHEGLWDHEERSDSMWSLFGEIDRARRARSAERRSREFVRLQDDWLDFWLHALRISPNRPMQFEPLLLGPPESKHPDRMFNRFRGFVSSGPGLSGETFDVTSAVAKSAPTVTRSDRDELLQSRSVAGAHA